MRIESELFKMPHARLIAHLYRGHGRWLTWMAGVATAIPLTLAVCLGDLRWVIVALMVVLIVIPMMLALLYINFALDQRIAFNVLPHRVSIEDGASELVLTLYPKMAKRAEDKVEDKDKGKDKDEVNDEEKELEDDWEDNAEEERVEKRFPMQDMGRYVIGRDYVIVEMKCDNRKLEGRGDGMLYLPASAFGGDVELKFFLDILYGREGHGQDEES